MKLVLQNWHALVASQLPGLLLTSMFVPSIPVPLGRVIVLHVGTALVTLLLLAAAAREHRAIQVRAAQITVFVLLTLGYPLFATMCGISRESGADSIVALAYVFVTFAILRQIGRVNDGDLSETTPVARVVVCGLAAISLVHLSSDSIKGLGRAWETEVTQLSEPVFLGPGSADDPDILHIVLDGMTSAKVLNAKFGTDVTPELNQFLDLGLRVESGAVANYPQTYPALASVLNAAYLDPLMPVLTGSASKGPLHELIQRSGVISALKTRGYEFTFIGSSYSAASRHAAADRCACDSMPVGEFEQAFLSITPARALPTWTTLYEFHRSEILKGFGDIATVPPSSRPRLIIAHILAPHPPFVFDARGDPITPPRSYGIDDASSFRGTRQEYRDGYAQQARFVLDRAARSVAAFLRSSHRSVVVLIHGDHGSGLDYDQNSVLPADSGARLSVFLAYRIAAPGRREVDTVGSPVNLYRAVFADRFGANLSRLPNKSYLVRFELPYDFTEVRVPERASSSMQAP